MISRKTATRKFRTFPNKKKTIENQQDKTNNNLSTVIAAGLICLVGAQVALIMAQYVINLGV